jgi:hypothetical protein
MSEVLEVVGYHRIDMTDQEQSRLLVRRDHQEVEPVAVDCLLDHRQSVALHGALKVVEDLLLFSAGAVDVDEASKDMAESPALDSGADVSRRIGAGNGNGSCHWLSFLSSA